MSESKIENIKIHLTTGEIQEQSESLWSYKVFYDGIDLGAFYYHPGNLREKGLGIAYFMSFPLSEEEVKALKETPEWNQMKIKYRLKIIPAEDKGYFQFDFHINDEIKKRTDNLYLKFLKDIAENLKKFELSLNFKGQ